MAYDSAINVTDWTTTLSYSADTQQVGYQKAIVLGMRGINNPFSELIGGKDGMKPVTEVMDFRAIQGQEIVVTLDRPLGGAGTQGAASLNRVVPRAENSKHATYRAKIGLFAHMVAGEQLVQSQTLIGLDWDNRQRRKLAEYFAWKRADDFQFEMIAKSHSRNRIYPNNKASEDDLTTDDFMNLSTATRAGEVLNSNQAEPFDVTKTSSGDVLAYLLMGSHKAYSGLQGSNAYQNLLSNADVRGNDNRLFKGGLPDYFGMKLFKWNVQDGTQLGPKGAPCAPIAYLGTALPATSTTDLSATYITSGTTDDNNVAVPPLWFQYFRNAQYIGHEGEKIAADTSTQRYVAIQIISGADTGKIALYGYTTNNGNKLGGLTRLGASASGNIVTTLAGSSMTYNSGAWTTAAGANGFKGLSTGVVPAGSIIYQVNIKGTPIVDSFAMGRNMILAGWGNLAPNQGYNSGGGGGMGNPGQRLFEAQDGGRLFSVGWQQVWGATATKNADGMVNGYVRVTSAYAPSGWPDTV